MDTIVIFLSILGSIASIYSVFHIVAEKNVKSWRSVCKGVLKIKRMIIEHNQYPDLIVSLGVGGAVVGGMLAASLGRKPIVGIDRRYKWENGIRHTFVDIPQKMVFNSNFNNVLIVTGEIYEGASIKKAISFLNDQFPNSQIYSASMYVWENSDFFPTYYAYKIKKRVTPPWRLKGAIRDSKVDREISTFEPK